MRSDGAPSGVAVASATAPDLVAGFLAPARELAQRIGVDLALEQLHAGEPRQDLTGSNRKRTLT